jgi:hypothetical protein
MRLINNLVPDSFSFILISFCHLGLLPSGFAEMLRFLNLRVLSSGIKHCVVYSKSADVSEAYIISIFRVQDFEKEQLFNPENKAACLCETSDDF